MKTANKITPTAWEMLSAEQDLALLCLCHDDEKVTKGVWMVDDTLPAVELATAVTDESQGPTHWWQNGQWEPVTFLSIAEVA